MNFRRWLIVTTLVLCIVTGIAVPVYVWIRWPYQTAHEFLASVREGRCDDAGRMLVEPALLQSLSDTRINFSRDGDKRWLLPPDFWSWWLRKENVEFPWRSVSDWRAQRCYFATKYSPARFAAQGGKVIVISVNPEMDHLEEAYYTALACSLRANRLRQSIEVVSRAASDRFPDRELIIRNDREELQRVDAALANLAAEHPFLTSIELR